MFGPWKVPLPSGPWQNEQSRAQMAAPELVGAPAAGGVVAAGAAPRVVVGAAGPVPGTGVVVDDVEGAVSNGSGREVDGVVEVGGSEVPGAVPGVEPVDDPFPAAGAV